MALTLQNPWNLEPPVPVVVSVSRLESFSAQASSKHSDRKLLALQYLRDFSFSAENNTAFRDSGAIDTLVALLSSSTEECVCDIVLTLSNLSMDSRNRQYILDAGFLPISPTLICSRVGDISGSAAAITAKLLLDAKKQGLAKDLADGGLGAQIVSALVTLLDTNDAFLQEVGARAVGNIPRVPELVPAFDKAQAVPHLANVFRRARDIVIKRITAQALANASYIDYTHFQLVASHGGVPWMLGMLTSQDDELFAVAAGFLAHHCRIKRQLDDLIANGLITTLFKVCNRTTLFKANVTTIVLPIAQALVSICARMDIAARAKQLKIIHCVAEIIAHPADSVAAYGCDAVTQLARDAETRRELCEGTGMGIIARLLVKPGADMRAVNAASYAILALVQEDKARQFFSQDGVLERTKQIRGMV